MNNEKLFLKNPSLAPTDEVLKQALGESFAAYEAFQSALPGLEIEQQWQWYKPHKAWFARGWHRWTTPRGTKKEKTLYWLHVYDGYFNIAVWFLEKNRLELLKSDSSEKTKELIKTGKIFAEKLQTFPVSIDILDTAALADIYELINYKKRLEL